MIGSIGCPETSVRKYYYTLCNEPEERRSHLLGEGCLISRTSEHETFKVNNWKAIVSQSLTWHTIVLGSEVSKKGSNRLDTKMACKYVCRGHGQCPGEPLGLLRRFTRQYDSRRHRYSETNVMHF
jgi:hypothetical protein